MFSRCEKVNLAHRSNVMGSRKLSIIVSLEKSNRYIQSLYRSLTGAEDFLHPQPHASGFYHFCFTVDKEKGKRIEIEIIDMNEIEEEHFDYCISKGEILWMWKLNRLKLKQFISLRWIQTASSGVDHILPEIVSKSGIILTNARGFHGVPGAEYVLGAILGHLKGLFANARANVKKEYAKLAPESLKNQCIGVIGCGSIGREIARICQLHRMKVIGLRFTAKQHPQFDKTYFPDQIEEFLSIPRFIVIAAPLTRRTHHLINRTTLKNTRKDAVLINIARGEIVDEPALIHALNEGMLNGAVLDVWEGDRPSKAILSHEKILVTPHFSTITRQYIDDATRVFSENLIAYVSGKTMKYIVDIDREY